MLVILLTAFLTHDGCAQVAGAYTKFAEVDAAIGDTEGSAALSFNIDHALGKNRRIVVGLAARFTAYLGKNQYYITAPAALTSGSTGPGVIFKENIEANIDTFLIRDAQVNALNLAVTLGYNFSERLMLRFNIDAVGFSFGKSTTGNYINGSQGAVESSSPTAFNALLISDNDKGSLNSAFFARYLVGEKWALKGGLQFLFTEYTTDTAVQKLPEPNDRFRNKSLMFMIGLARKL